MKRYFYVSYYKFNHVEDTAEIVDSVMDGDSFIDLCCEDFDCIECVTPVVMQVKGEDE